MIQPEYPEDTPQLKVRACILRGLEAQMQLILFHDYPIQDFYDEFEKFIVDDNGVRRLEYCHPSGYILCMSHGLYWGCPEDDFEQWDTIEEMTQIEKSVLHLFWELEKDL